MKTLYEALRAHTPQHQALIKHLEASGIHEWGDLTRANLADFRDYLANEVAPSSAKTYLASLRAIMGRYQDEGVIPFTKFSEVLKGKGERPVKTFLTPEEIERLSKVRTNDANERYVLDEFIVGCRIGCRHSDLEQLSEENISNGYLTYTSIKTGITATIPCSDDTLARISRVRERVAPMRLATYNTIIRRLCLRAGLTERVKVHKGGVDKVGPKYLFISSHSARISLCTNLAYMGVPLNDIASLVGHRSVTTTQNYIVRQTPKLNEEAMAYFK